MTSKGTKTEKAILALLTDLGERLQTFEEQVNKSFKKTDERLNSVYDKVMSGGDGDTSTGKKPKRAKKERSASEPRKPPTAYIIWKNEYYPKVVSQFEDVEDKDERKQKIADALTEGWKDEKTKEKYNKKYEKLKATHVKALADYKAKKAGGSDEDGGNDSDGDGDDESEEQETKPKKKPVAKATTSKAKTPAKKGKKAAPPPEDTEEDDDDSDSSDDEVVKKLRGKGKASAPNDKELEDLLNDSDEE